MVSKGDHLRLRYDNTGRLPSVQDYLQNWRSKNQHRSVAYVVRVVKNAGNQKT